MINSNIGIDLVRIDNFKGYTIEDTFLTKNFTEDELKYCFKKKENSATLSGKFAAKEAVIKIISNKEISPYSLKEIEILNNDNGSPFLNKCPIKKYTNHINLSITHDGDYAVAVAILNKWKQ